MNILAHPLRLLPVLLIVLAIIGGTSLVASGDQGKPDTDLKDYPKEHGCVYWEASDGVPWLFSPEAAISSPSLRCYSHSSTPWIQPSASSANPVVVCRHGFWDSAELVSLGGVQRCIALWFNQRPDAPLFLPWKNPDFYTMLNIHFSGSYCAYDPVARVCIEICDEYEGDDGTCSSDLRWVTPHQIGQCDSLNHEFAAVHNYETDVAYVYRSNSELAKAQDQKGLLFLSKGGGDEEFYKDLGKNCLNKKLIDKAYRIAGVTGSKCSNVGDYRFDKINLGSGNRYRDDEGDASLVWKQGEDSHFVLRSECVDYAKSPLLSDHYRTLKAPH